MEGFNQERRGLFDGLKVPFDVKAILLAAVGIVVFAVGVWVIELGWPLEGAAEKHGLLCSVAGNVVLRIDSPGHVVAEVCGLPKTHAPIYTLQWIAFLAWCAVVWSFFAGAICRIAAMKIAREESLELTDALKFAADKFFPNLFSLLFVVAIVGFFYLVCDATIAGGVGRIPWVGEVIVAILFFLVMLSSFFIVFTGALGILGFNLSAAAIATEASDTFDGVSRSWNYIIARPWHVLLTFGLSIAYVAVFLFFGNMFLKVSVKSLAVSRWGMSHEARLIERADPDLATKLGVRLGDPVRLPGKGEYLYKLIITKDPDFKWDRVVYNQRTEGQEPLKLDVTRAIEGSLSFSATVIWAWVSLAQILMWGYAVSYFLSAQTTVYFLLRKEVEGDDYSEINLEEDEEEDLEYGGDAPKPSSTLPAPAGSAAAPAKLPVVGAGGGAPPTASPPPAEGTPPAPVKGS